MKTILAAAFMQETNRYCPGVTGLQDFANGSAYFDKDAILQAYKSSKSEMMACIHYFFDKPEYTVEPVCALSAAPGPVVAQDVWERVKDALVEAIRNTPKVDGIFLALHGAMVTEDYEDGEGELLEVVRELVGADVPIVAPLDLHANITKKMLQYADGLFPCDYYPHTDTYEAGIRAAECLYRTLEGQIRPVLCGCKLDMVFPYMPHEHPVFNPFLLEAQGMRGTGELIDVTICHGFFPADIYEQGVTVLAIANGDRELAQKTADSLGAKIFDARKELRRSYLTVDEAIERAKNSDTYPVVIADVADNPGAGATGDAPELLKKFIEHDVQDAVMAILFDPETVAMAEKAGVGNEVEVAIGGKRIPHITGGPVRCKAYVKAITDGRYRNRDKMYHGKLNNLGKTALLRIGGIYVVVTSVRMQALDLEVYRSVGIQPQDMKILAVKSTMHYRASFSNVSSVMLEVETPALAIQSPEAAPLEHSRRPIYPLDDI